jgi:hypothetical protein
VHLPYKFYLLAKVNEIIEAKPKALAKMPVEH